MTVEISRLANGLTVATECMPHLETASVGVWVGAGARSEDAGQHGMSHLLEHMAFKGTTRRTARQIAEEIEAVGGEINAATSVENTAYFARVLGDDVGLAVDILSDILTDSVFDPEELRREQNVVLQEIGAALDSPEDHVFDRFQETAFQGQPIGRPILGTAETVASFTSAQLDAYLRDHYCGPTMVLAAAGKVDHAEVLKMAEDRFGGLAASAHEAGPAASYRGGSWAEERDLQEAQITLGFSGCSYASGQQYAAQLLASALGGGMSSRLFQEARENRGLCYSISAFHWAYRDTGLFGIHAATGEGDVSQLMEVVTGELVRISEDLGADELARAKAQMKASVLMSLESPASRASQIGRQILVYGRPLTTQDVIQRIETVDVATVRDLARSIFQSETPTLAMIGPAGSGYPPDQLARRLHGG